jgi:AraC-like DNA-binding protein
MITNKYFEDISFPMAGIYPGYCCNIRDSHPRHYSLELIASGKMYFQRLPEPVRIIDFPALRWQGPDETYNYGPVDDSGWEHYFILFYGPRAERIYRDGFCQLSENCWLPVRNVDWFRNAFRELHELLFVRMQPDSARAVLLLEEMLLNAAGENSVPESFQRYAGQLEEMCAAIKAEPQRDYDLAQLAGKVGLSYSHFRKIFCKHVGMPPHRYILKSRLAVAEHQLKTTDAPLKEIAFLLHLGDPAQFIKAFRQVYGLSPAQYRHRFGYHTANGRLTNNSR